MSSPDKKRDLSFFGDENTLWRKLRKITGFVAEAFKMGAKINAARVAEMHSLHDCSCERRCE